MSPFALLSFVSSFLRFLCFFFFLLYFSLHFSFVPMRAASLNACFRVPPLPPLLSSFTRVIYIWCVCRGLDLTVGLILYFIWFSLILVLSWIYINSSRFLPFRSFSICICLFGFSFDCLVNFVPHLILLDSYTLSPVFVIFALFCAVYFCLGP